MNSINTVSIAMCTYNGEPYLKQQLESILTQTVQPNELVVCDDCSKDRTLEILYAFKDRCIFPVTIIVNEKNIGINKNFENAIDHCSGKFIILSDQDDIWMPTKIEEIINVFQANPNCGYVFSNADLIDENSNSLGRDLWRSIKFTHKRYMTYLGGDQLEVMLNDGNFIYGMTMAFRSDYRSRLLPIDSNSYACTHDTWISLILSGLGAYGVAISESLVKYRQHEKQLAGGGRSFGFVDFLKNIFKRKSEIDMAFVNALMNIVERLSQEDNNKEHVVFSIKQLTQKAEHLRARHLASYAKGFTKLKIVFYESVTGRYGRYSGSIKSIIKDLFLRSEKVTVPYTHALPDIDQPAKSPNFFVVGAAKAGTTYIGYCLGMHPEIYISPIKEPHFFSTDFRIEEFCAQYRKNVTFDVTKYLNKHPLQHKHTANIDDLLQYLQLFREVENEKVIGELSVGYLYSNNAAENIFKFNPNAKIVIILRQPVERAYSHYLMSVRDFRDYDSGFIDALERDFSATEKGWGKSHLYVELGLYFEQVSRYLEHFPASHVKILLYEDLKNDSVGFFKQLCDFLEVDPSLLSETNLLKRINFAALPRLKIPKEYLFIANMFKQFLPARCRNLMVSSSNIPKLRSDEFEQAMKYFYEDIQKLSVLIDRDLQSWYQIRK